MKLFLFLSSFFIPVFRPFSSFLAPFKTMTLLLNDEKGKGEATSHYRYRLIRWSILNERYRSACSFILFHAVLSFKCHQLPAGADSQKDHRAHRYNYCFRYLIPKADFPFCSFFLFPFFFFSHDIIVPKKNSRGSLVNEGFIFSRGPPAMQAINTCMC